MNATFRYYLVDSRLYRISFYKVKTKEERKKKNPDVFVFSSLCCHSICNSLLMGIRHSTSTNVGIG